MGLEEGEGTWEVSQMESWRQDHTGPRRIPNSSEM